MLKIKTISFIVFFISLFWLCFPTLSQNSRVFSIDLDLTNTFIAVGTSTALEIRTVADNTHVHTIPITGGVAKVKWSRNGNAVAIIEWENQVSIWNANTGTPMGIINGIGADFSLTDIEWTLDDSQLFILEFSSELMLWNIDWVTYAHSEVFRESYLGGGRDFELSPDGSILAIASGGGVILRNNVPNPAIYEVIFEEFGDSFLSVNWNDNGTILVAGGFNTPARIWDVINSTSLNTIGEDFESGVVQWVNNTQFATTGTDFIVRIWDVNTEELIYQAQLTQSIVAWDSSELELVSLPFENGNITIYSIDIANSVDTFNLIDTHPDARNKDVQGDAE